MLLGLKSRFIVLSTGYAAAVAFVAADVSRLNRNQVRSLILPMSPPFLLCPPVSKIVLEAGLSLQVIFLKADPE